MALFADFKPLCKMKQPDQCHMLTAMLLLVGGVALFFATVPKNKLEMNFKPNKHEFLISRKYK